MKLGLLLSELARSKKAHSVYLWTESVFGIGSKALEIDHHTLKGSVKMRIRVLAFE